MQIWRSKEGSKHNLNAVAFYVTFVGATWRFMLNKFRSLPFTRQDFTWDHDVINLNGSIVWLIVYSTKFYHD